MPNVLELSEINFPKKGLLVHSNLYTSCIDAYVFDSLGMNLSKSPEIQRGDVLNIIGKMWEGFYESPNYPYKGKEPYNRAGDSYIPLGFDRFDAAIDLSDGGRFFSIKEAHNNPQYTEKRGFFSRKRIRIPPYYVRVERYAKEGAAFIQPQECVELFSKDLGYALELAGVPRADVLVLQREIFGKLGLDTSKISQDYRVLSETEMREVRKRIKARDGSIADVVLDLYDKRIPEKTIGELVFGDPVSGKTD